MQVHEYLLKWLHKHWLTSRQLSRFFTCIPTGDCSSTITILLDGVDGIQSRVRAVISITIDLLDLKNKTRVCLLRVTIQQLICETLGVRAIDVSLTQDDIHTSTDIHGFPFLILSRIWSDKTTTAKYECQIMVGWLHRVGS